jgi:lipoprotein-anchoring transpeptidase ErfK/SrfK
VPAASITWRNDGLVVVTRVQSGYVGSGRSLRLTAVACGLTAAAVALGTAAPQAAAGGVVVKPTQELVALLTAHAVVSSPDEPSSSRITVQAFRPITGEPTVLPVTGQSTTADGAHWLRVMLPGRPNGSQGWIGQRGTRLTATAWHLVIDTAIRRVLVYRRGRLVRSFAAIVGKPTTPTPAGAFFVEESVRLPPGSPGAPFALALSARSDVLQDFAGGPGQIAIHGVANLGGTLGSAVSHGCVRIAGSSIAWLAARIGTGVPVSVQR